MNAPAEITAWNQAHERLRLYLATFVLGDEIQLERIALRLLDEAREKHRADPAQAPIAVTLRHAQGELTRWLARNLGEPERREAQVLAGGMIALLLSGLKWALAIGFIGGFFPALRAARLPVTVGLREL